MGQIEMTKNTELPTVTALKAYHIYVITEAARVWPRPVRLGLLPELLQSSIQIGLRLLIHSIRTYPFCNDTLAFSHSLMVIPVRHCLIQSEFSIRLNDGSMIHCPSNGFRQANPAMHLGRHPGTSVMRLLLLAARLWQALGTYAGK